MTGIAGLAAERSMTGIVGLAASPPEAAYHSEPDAAAA